jgi:hypothetical protein
VLGERQESNFLVLSKAVARAHSRLFTEEPYKDPRTLRVIALALTDLVPIHRGDTYRELTALELTAERFSALTLDRYVVPKRRFEAALESMQGASLDQARASLTLRQCPGWASGRRY